MSERIVGSLGTSDGMGVVRITAQIDADIRDVWSALTQPERLATWYGVVEGDLCVGGSYHARVHMSGWEGDGVILVCDPPHRLVITGKDPDEPNEDTTEVTLNENDGRTVVEVVQIGPPMEAVWAYGAGMQIHVEDLADHVAGRERRQDPGRFSELEPTYRQLAAGLSEER